VTPSSFARSMTFTRPATRDYLPFQLARIASGLSRGGRLGFLNACPSRPACSAFSTHSTAAQMYAPRPAALP
jgi:hypothetical protein